MIMHGFSLAFALGWTLFGVFTALKVLLSPLFQLPVSYDAILGTSASNDFISPLVLGLLSTLIYHLLLRDIIQRGLIERTTLLLSEGTIAALLLAGVFWWACGLLLYNLLQTLAPVPAGPDAPAWLMTVALLITGVSYIPLDLVIRRRFDIDPAHAIGPRRSLVLALLAVGILTLAIGGAIALYAWGTALLGSPLTNWQQLAHSGLAATIVGAALVAIYVWPLRGEHLLARPARSAPIPETPAAPGTIEDILDELLAGQITRSEAAVRLRALNGTATLLLI